MISRSPLIRCGLVFAVICGMALAGCRPNPTNVETERSSKAPQTNKTTIDARQLPSFQPRELAVLRECKFHNGRAAQLNSILEIVGGGVGCSDIDRDGLDDLIFPCGGELDGDAKRVVGVNSALLQNQGSWDFRDITASARIDTAVIYSHGISCVDYDHDGWDELLIYGFQGVLLLRNQGDGTFVDITASANLDGLPWITTAAWIDVNQDQQLDLYLGSYVNWSFDNNPGCKSKEGLPDVCSPNAFEGMPNHLLLNSGEGDFTPDGRLRTDQPAKSLGAVVAEFRPGQGHGLYVANDQLANYLFIRRSQYQERAMAAGVAVDDSGVANGSMGVAVFDFNQDRLLDLFVTNFEHELMALYVGVDGEFFQHASRQKGLNRPDLRVVGFGVVPGDFDNDGDEDVIFVSGHVQYHPDAGQIQQRPAFLRNESGRTFNKLDPEGPFFTTANAARGLAASDLDQDGDLDFIASNLLGEPSLVENTTDAHHGWLQVTLVGTKSSRTPVGATAELRVGDKVMVRQRISGGSYLSQSQAALHFAWPRSQVDRPATLSIHWPGSTQPQTLQVAPNQHLSIIQP